MAYIDQTLIFENDKIYYPESALGIDCEVMMDWEHSIMSASAAYVTQNGGDILEIGFGMGISAGYIQSHSISSHTIMENHPDVIPKAQAWASDKSNVTIITGSWWNIFSTRLKSSDNGKTWTNTLGTFDGLFYDTYGDNHQTNFSSSLNHLMSTNGRATWWNSVTGSNYYNIPNVNYDVINVNPPENSYFNHQQYYLPKKEF